MNTARNNPVADPLSATKFSNRLIARAFLALLAIAPMFAPTFAAERGAPIKLYTEVSQPGEWTDGFIERIAQRAVVKGEALRSEVCGVVKSRPDGRFEITLYTTRQVRACLTPVDEGGFTSFHTHPREGGGRKFSDADYAFHGYLAVGHRLYYQAGRGTERRLR